MFLGKRMLNTHLNEIPKYNLPNCVPIHFPNHYGCKMYFYLLALLSPSFFTDYLHGFYYTIDPLYP